MQTVLITGASSDIGSAIALYFAKNNYNLILTYYNNEANLNKLTKREEFKNINYKCLYLDLNSDDSINNVLTEGIKEFKNIDVLVNNASINKDNLISDKTRKEFLEVLNTNVCGTYTICKMYVEKMKKGCIVNISSTNGIDTQTEYSIDYDASKAAIISLTHSYAKYYPNFRINCVCPGWVDTKATKEMHEAYKKEEIEKIIMKRFAQPEEIASAVYFLASEEASYINNSVLRVDGGIDA